MKSIFYILSILVIGASAYFAFDNKSKLEDEMAPALPTNIIKEIKNSHAPKRTAPPLPTPLPARPAVQFRGLRSHACAD